MKTALKITYKDNNRNLTIILSEYPTIICDGQNFIFTDDDGQDHKVNTVDVFNIEAVGLEI